MQGAEFEQVYDFGNLYAGFLKARRGKRHKPSVAKFISIHALREEGDSKNRDKISIFKQIIQHSARI